MSDELKLALEALDQALEEVRSSLIREGLENRQAQEEATDYVSVPGSGGASTEELRELEERLGEKQVPGEFVRVAREIDLGSCSVWDFRCRRIARGNYLQSVGDLTELLEEVPFALPRGLVVASTESGDLVLLSEGNGVFVLSHDDRQLIAQAAPSLVSFLRVNARLAAAYYRRIEAGHQSIEWVDEILVEALEREWPANPDWARRSLLQRPRPI